MMKKEREKPLAAQHRTHERWIARLSAKLPTGVPADPTLKETSLGNRAWPHTFGEVGPDGKPKRWGETAESCCLQCMFCIHYEVLDGALGLDWGACSNEASEYDGRVVFEHWTCKEFTKA